jgi:ubiquinone/menaquinone biosynthesis C-methylase UbiE
MIMTEKSKVAKRYDRWSGIYDSVDTFPLIGRSEKRWRIEAIGMLDLKPDDVILDVGTGTGLMLPWIAEHLTSGKVIGIDLSEKMLARARERVKECGFEDRVELSYEDAEGMSFQDGMFDKVIASYALTTIPDPVKMISEIYRVLKPKGQAVILDTGPPNKPIGKPVYYWMRFSAKVFGYTDISRDPYGIISSTNSFTISEERRHYATTVYLIGLLRP